MKKAIPSERNSISKGTAVQREHRAHANSSNYSSSLVFRGSKEWEKWLERYVGAS